MSDAREPDAPLPTEAKPSAARSPLSRLLDRLGFLKRHIVAVATVGAVLSGLVGYWTTYRTVHEVIAPTVSGSARPVAQSPPAMSIVVTPLIAPRGDKEAALFTDSLTQELATRLGRMNGQKGPVRIVPMQGGLADEKTDTREIGRRLNVRYVLEGNVTPGRDGNTVNLRLIDVATGGQTWAHREPVQMSDVATETSVKLLGLAQQMRNAIIGAEHQRVASQPLDQLTAQELVLRASMSSDETLASVLEARKLADKALQLDPNSVPALLLRANLADRLHDLDPGADARSISRELDEDTARAITLDPTNAWAWFWRSVALQYQGRWDATLDANATAIKLNPDEARFLNLRATWLMQTGRPAEALPLLDRSLALDETTSNVADTANRACNAYLLLGQAEKAVPMCEKAVDFDRAWYMRAPLVAAYANHGDFEKAGVAKTELLRTRPGLTVAQARAYDSGTPEYWRLADQYFYGGLRKAGIPEQ